MSHPTPHGADDPHAGGPGGGHGHGESHGHGHGEGHGHGGGGHGGHGKHKHAGHGGGGHGGSWIVTYSDMITLLMAFFIAIITFSSKDNSGKQTSANNSFVPGLGGPGVAGPAHKGGAEAESVVWRPRFRLGPSAAAGAEFASVYRDPAEDASAAILRALAAAPPAALKDGFDVRLPLSLFFSGSSDRLTASGESILRAVAANLRDLPYDFEFRVPDGSQVRRAVAVCTFLSSRGGVHPGRLAVGVRDGGEDPYAAWLVLTPQN
jgi:hypothetical protein